MHGQYLGYLHLNLTDMLLQKSGTPKLNEDALILSTENRTFRQSNEFPPHAFNADLVSDSKAVKLFLHFCDHVLEYFNIFHKCYL